MCYDTCVGGQRTHVWGSEDNFSSSTMWVLGIELGSSILQASAFTCSTISIVPVFLILRSCLNHV